MTIMNFSRTVLKNLFSKPATRMYPQVPRNYPPRTRGHIDIEIDACVFCGLCSKKCPTHAISVDRNARTWSIERFSCIQCGYCVESCPKKCLGMGRSYPEPGAVKKVETFQGPPAPEKPAAPKAPAQKPEQPTP